MERLRRFYVFYLSKARSASDTAREHSRWWRVYDRARERVEERGQANAVAICLLCGVSLICALCQSQLMALAVFAGMGVALLAVVQPALALLILCLCTALPSLVIALPGYHMHPVEPAVGLCLGVVVLRRPPARLSLSHLLAVGFLLLAVISFAHVPELTSVQANDVYGADKRLLALCLVLGAFFCGTLLAPYVKDGGGFLTGVLFVSLPVYLVGLAQVMGWPLAAWLEASGANDPTMNEGRLWGPFPWSVNFGMYLVNLFAVALVCWLLGKRRWQRAVGAVMTLATALCIVGTGTRSAAAAAIAITLLALGMTRRFRLLGSISLFAALLGMLFSARIAAFFTHDETSTANRLLIWNLALKLIKGNPWLGIGLEQFHYYYAQLIVSKADELGALGVHPHEQYLEWAMESGLPWLLIGILLLGSIIFSCIHTYYQAQPVERLIPLAALLAIIANTLIGFFDAPLDQLEGPIVLFLLAGLALGQMLSTKGYKKVFDAEHLRALAPSALDLFSLLVPSVTISGEARNGDRRHKQRKQVSQAAKRRELMPKASPSDGHQTLSKKATRTSGALTGRTIILQMLSWGIALPLIFPTTALLARYLGPVQYGEYSLTFPFLTLFALLSGTGMDPLIIRQLSGSPRQAWSEILSYALGSRFVSTLACTAIALLVACLLPVHEEQRNLFLVGCTSLLFSFSFNGPRIILSHGFRAEQRVGALAALEAANRMLTAVLIALVVILHLSLLWIYILIVYSDLPAFLLQAWLAYKRYDLRPRFSLPLLRKHMLSGLPLLGHRALTLLSGQIDLLVLTLESTPLNVGIYALASRITDPLISIAHVYVNGLYPVLCVSFREDRRQFAELYNEAVRILLLVMLPCAMIVTMEAGRIVHILGGGQYSAATGVVQLLMWAMVLTFLNHLAEGACTAANLELRIPLVTTVSTAVNLVANLLLVPHWQIMGAGLAALSSEGVTFCMFMLFLKHYVDPLPLLGTALSILVSNLPALAFLRWQDAASFIITVPLSIAFVLVSYLASGTLVRRDILRLLTIVRYHQNAA